MIGIMYLRFIDKNLGKLIQELDQLSQAPINKSKVKGKE